MFRNLKLLPYSKELGFFVFIWMFVACTSNPSASVDLDTRIGQWNMLEAKRNGNITELLDKAFIKFTETELIHNFNGDTIRTAYTMEGNKILSSDEFLAEMELDRMSQDTAIFKSTINGFRFQFLMKKDEK